MASLKLYFAPGACSRVPLIALHQVGVPFETQVVAFKRGDHRNPEFLKLNPAGKIPLLLVDGVPLSQNSAILQWLADSFPEAGLLARTDAPIDRARQLSKLLRFSADLHPLVTRIRMPHFFCDLPDGPARVAEMAHGAMAIQLPDFEQQLSASDWLSGEQWGALDAYLHWVWFRITGAGFDGSRFPAISAFYQRTLALDAVKGALAIEQEGQAWLEENGLSL